MSRWIEKINFSINDGEEPDKELEIENPDGTDAYIYKIILDPKTLEPVKREFIGSVPVEDLMMICRRMIDLWEEEAEENSESTDESKESS